MLSAIAGCYVHIDMYTSMYQYICVFFCLASFSSFRVILSAGMFSIDVVCWKTALFQLTQSHVFTDTCVTATAKISTHSFNYWIKEHMFRITISAGSRVKSWIAVFLGGRMCVPRSRGMQGHDIFERALLCVRFMWKMALKFRVRKKICS